MAVNLSAPMQIVAELMPRLAQQSEAHIVNVCSVVARLALPGASSYQASKVELLRFTACPAR